MQQQGAEVHVWPKHVQDTVARARAAARTLANLILPLCILLLAYGLPPLIQGPQSLGTRVLNDSDRVLVARGITEWHSEIVWDRSILAVSASGNPVLVIRECSSPQMTFYLLNYSQYSSWVEYHSAVDMSSFIELSVGKPVPLPGSTEYYLLANYHGEDANATYVWETTCSLNLVEYTGYPTAAGAVGVGLAGLTIVVWLSSVIPDSIRAIVRSGVDVAVHADVRGKHPDVVSAHVQAMYSDELLNFRILSTVSFVLDIMLVILYDGLLGLLTIAPPYHYSFALMAGACGRALLGITAILLVVIGLTFLRMFMNALVSGYALSKTIYYRVPREEYSRFKVALCRNETKEGRSIFSLGLSAVALLAGIQIYSWTSDWALVLLAIAMGGGIIAGRSKAIAMRKTCNELGLSLAEAVSLQRPYESISQASRSLLDLADITIIFAVAAWILSSLLFISTFQQLLSASSITPDLVNTVLRQKTAYVLLASGPIAYYSTSFFVASMLYGKKEAILSAQYRVETVSFIVAFAVLNLVAFISAEPVFTLGSLLLSLAGAISTTMFRTAIKYALVDSTPYT